MINYFGYKKPLFIVATILVVVVTCYVLLVAVFRNSYVICFGTPFPSHNDVERSALFQLPPSSRQLQYYANGLNRKSGCTIWIQFTISPSDINMLSESTNIVQFEPTQLEQEVFLYLLSKQGWKQPENILSGYNYTEIDAMYISQWVMIDISEPNEYTFYIITNKEWL
jgi:hypothetical protein